jgi:acyl-CoA synthetase (NDP forming)/GNAT superfamily N-acetyltransferase
MSLLRALLQPRSIAVVTGSAADAVADAVLAHLEAKAPPGGCLRVVAGARAGKKGAPRDGWSAAGTPPDLAIVCTPAADAAAALDAAGQAGVRTAVVCTEDPDGRSADTPFKQALVAAARKHGLRFLGPGSAGVCLPAAGLDASWFPVTPPAGRLAIVAQSATLAASAVAWAAGQGIGLSRVVTVGDEADLGLDHVLDALAADTRTGAILVQLHAVRDGRGFMTSARAAARVKPVVALRPPSVAEDAAATGRDRVLAAAFARAGVLHVGDVASWFEAAAALTRPVNRPRGGLVVVSNGRGPAQIAVAAASAGFLAAPGERTIAALQALVPGCGAEVNPLVLPRDATPELWEKALAALAADAGVAAASVIVAPSPASGGGDAAAATDEALAAALSRVARQPDMQLSACWFGRSPASAALGALTAAGVTHHALPEGGVRTFAYRHRWQQTQAMLRQVPAAQRQTLAAATHADASDARALATADEAEDEAFLQGYGALWRGMEAGDAALIDDAVRRLMGCYGLVVDGTDAAPSVPLGLAITDDAEFGRIVHVAVHGDVTRLLPPLGRTLVEGPARDASHRLAAAGHDVPPDAITDAAIRLATFACDLPEVEAIELAARRADDGALRFRLARVAAAVPRRDHLAIHPYPRELEARVTAKDGRALLVRPIRIEDVPRYRAMLERIPKDDLFLRFCNQYADIALAIPVDLLANLVRFDYSRDMTLVAVAADATGAPEILGVVDAFVSPGGEEAEFSVLVRSDLGGSGLGKLLMERIIDYCRGRGVATLFGLVLRRNPRMLGLAKRLGFVRVADEEEEEDEDMVKVVLAL